MLRLGPGMLFVLTWLLAATGVAVGGVRALLDEGAQQAWAGWAFLAFAITALLLAVLAMAIEAWFGLSDDARRRTFTAGLVLAGVLVVVQLALVYR